MTMKYVIESLDLLDRPTASAEEVADVLRSRGVEDVACRALAGPRGDTVFIKIGFPGAGGKTRGGAAPTLGILGTLGGVGARPELAGMVSDADGAVVAVACALKLADMARQGDVLPGDVMVSTHICPDAPTQPHVPVPFMNSPLDQHQAQAEAVDPAMDAVLSVDATKGNRILNWRGFAISPTVKEGYILRVSEDLLDIAAWTSGQPPRVLPITTQDITPYGNGVFHMNSIMQPCIATKAPVVGVALTAETAVPGCYPMANQPADLEAATRFCLGVAQALGRGECSFYNESEFDRLVELYGALNKLQG